MFNKKSKSSKKKDESTKPLIEKAEVKTEKPKQEGRKIVGVRG